jgi:hypothetical protein
LGGNGQGIYLYTYAYIYHTYACTTMCTRTKGHCAQLQMGGLEHNLDAQSSLLLFVLVTQLLPGRTDNAVKNRFYSGQRRKMRSLIKSQPIATREELIGNTVRDITFMGVHRTISYYTL